MAYFHYVTCNKISIFFEGKIIYNFIYLREKWHHPYMMIYINFDFYIKKKFKL